MNPFVLISLITLGIFGILLQLKKEFRILNFFYVLLFTTISIWASNFYSDTSPIYGLIAIVSLNYGVSYISIFRKTILRATVPLLTLILFIFYFDEGVIAVLENSYSFVNKFLVLGALLSIFTFQITHVKVHFLRKLSVGLEESEFIKLVFCMLTGLTAFLGFFAASSFGVLVIAAFALSASFYYEGRVRSVSVSLLGLMTLPLLASIASITEVNLLEGDVLKGLFIGAFGAYFISKASNSTKSSTRGVAIAYFSTFSLMLGLLLLGMMYSKMGGMDAFIGAVAGLSMVAVFVDQKYSLGVLLLVLIAIGSYTPQFMVNNELMDFEAVTQGDGHGGKGLEKQEENFKLSDLTGHFEFVKDSSIVSFVLGAEGETSGAFKKVSGGINLNEDLGKSALNVTLNLDDFTTFNGFRDGALMEESYFNQEKYPTLNYTSSSMEKIDEFTYKVLGSFAMLGVSHVIEVTLKWVQINDVNFLLGEGAFDRTLFGMSPSATEGNVVSFNYRVQLSQ